jgi:hypothetical protein
MLKKILIAVCFVGFGTAGFAQVRSGSSSDPLSQDEAANQQEHFKPRLSLGVGIGFANLFGNFPTSVTTPAARMGIGSRITPGLIVGVETFFGQLASKQNPNHWTATGFSETGSFAAVDVNGKITLGDYMKYPDRFWKRLVSGIYVGSGFGVVHVSNTAFSGQFSSNNVEDNINLRRGLFTKKDVTSTYIPLNLGLRYHLGNFLGTNTTQLMLNYQINYSYSNYLGCFSVPSSVARNLSNDCYTVITIGLSFKLTKD